MAVTFANVQTRVQNLVGSHSAMSTTELQQLIQNENVPIVNDYPWSNRKGDNIIATVAPYSAGTITTVGTAVTGASTTFTSGMANRWLTGGTDSAFYKITTFGSATSLTLEAAIASGDLTTATAYTIFQHVYSLASNVERVVSMVGGQGSSFNYTLTEVTRQDIDRLDPTRSTRTSMPQYYSMRERDSNNNLQVEIWPVPSAAYQLRYEFIQTGDLVNGTDVPLYRSDVLVYKSASAAAFMLYSKTGDQAWVDLADRYYKIYTEQLKGALMDDLGRWSASQRIRDFDSYAGPGSDYFLSHDPGFVGRF